MSEEDDTHSDGTGDSQDIVTEEMLWERIPEVEGIDRAATYYELSARIYARGQYDEALALAETARDIYAELGASAPTEGLAQAYSAIGYNLNQLKRINEAANAMSKAVELLRESKSPIAIDLACTLGEWWYSSKEYAKTIECMTDCVQEHLVDGNESGAANDLYLIGCAHRKLQNFQSALDTFREARALFKKLHDVINVARTDQKIASCLYALGDGEGALQAAQKSHDVFVTAHESYRATYSLFELGKAQILLGNVDEGLRSLEQVLEAATESENKDFEFIIEVERKIAAVLRSLGRDSEADDIERRLNSVSEVIED